MPEGIMKARLLPVFAVALVIACDGTTEPTAPSARGNTSNVISDGAHGGANKDFFFLPPLMPSPTSSPNFDAGKFNGGLRPSLQVQICELAADHLSAQGRPTDATTCASVPPIANFAPGSVQLVANPRSQIGWWSVFNLPADGFYYVLWDSHATNRLDASKYYRIKVSIAGLPDLLGYADVDPIQNLTQWKNALTGEVIQMVNGSILPIPFRVENGGGSILCGTASLCNSATVTNNSSAPQIIQVQGNNGPIAGVKIPDGKWLPDGGPQSVVFTIKQVNTGVNDQAAGTQANPCHSAPIQQFNGCFSFTTSPTLQPIPGTKDKFLKNITVAVCFVLADKVPLDTREPWVQLWSSDVAENEAPRPLASAYSGDILSVHSEENCGTNYDPVITSNESGVRGLASAGWRALGGGLGKFFGVKTAYAVDLGLGGLTKGTSNIGPGLTAKIIANTSTQLTLTSQEAESPQTVRAKLVGTQVHNGEPLGDVTLTGNTHGIPGLPVTFTLTAGNGTLSPFGTEGAPSMQITTTSSPLDDSSLSGGLATVSWNLPTDPETSTPIPGTYTLTANGPATDGPITYTATVLAAPDLLISSAPLVLTPSHLGPDGGTIGLSPWTVSNQGGHFSETAAIRVGIYLSNDATITSGDVRLADVAQTPGLLEVGQSITWSGTSVQVPSPLAPGVYYIGILADPLDALKESNEANNYVSSPFVVPGVINFETYPNGVGVCNGTPSCPVTNQFADLGVVFSFQPTNPAGPLHYGSLCKTLHGPIGEGSNYEVSSPASPECSSWDVGSLSMTFPWNPAAVEFRLTGNDGTSAGPFDLVAFDAAGNAIPASAIERVSFVTYTDQYENTMRREVRRISSANGVARVVIDSDPALHTVDNLLITP
jgi:hypothetical protein